MRFLVVAAVFILLGAFAAIALGRATSLAMAFILGVLGTLAAGALFYFNKSDSVADSAIEYIADFTPPLISFSIVIGWWVGFSFLRFWRRH